MNVEFFITSMIVVLLPGTGVLYTLTVGLGRGVRASIIAAFGCTLGIVPHMVASIVGLAALLHASALAFQLIKYLGVLYLFYMAWTILREGGALAAEADSRPIRPSRLIMNAVMLNTLNPKLSLFLLAFLPQFVATDAASPTTTLVGLALAFMAMTFIVFVGYGAAASLARDYVVSRPAVLVWLRRSFAGAFALLGFRLAMAER